MKIEEKLICRKNGSVVELMIGNRCIGDMFNPLIAQEIVKRVNKYEKFKKENKKLEEELKEYKDCGMMQNQENHNLSYKLEQSQALNRELVKVIKEYKNFIDKLDLDDYMLEQEYIDTYLTDITDKVLAKTEKVIE
ncbi:hypothetical protein FQB35_10555 [Crassaminicella thermophila]|uniref:Uncharacterized protein n=2 Tax=Crassaminicella thermophila TaxID=2599308 RepID=A0A5C0SGF8_CRATE|nr:hypothetical protein [Crassaminicella thermophila]QEK12737.1 hypothetical protein FQB35_10555 [Crassaminicella thermophila]